MASCCTGPQGSGERDVLRRWRDDDRPKPSGLGAQDMAIEDSSRDGLFITGFVSVSQLIEVIEIEITWVIGGFDESHEGKPSMICATSSMEQRGTQRLAKVKRQILVYRTAGHSETVTQLGVNWMNGDIHGNYSNYSNYSSMLGHCELFIDGLVAGFIGILVVNGFIHIIKQASIDSGPTIAP